MSEYKKIWTEPLKYKQEEKQQHGISASILCWLSPICPSLQPLSTHLLNALCLGRLTFITFTFWLPVGRHLHKFRGKERSKAGEFSPSLSSDLIWPWRSSALYKRPQFLSGGLFCSCLLWAPGAMPSLHPLKLGSGNGSLLLLAEGCCTSFCWFGHARCLPIPL